MCNNNKKKEKKNNKKKKKSGNPTGWLRDGGRMTGRERKRPLTPIQKMAERRDIGNPLLFTRVLAPWGSGAEPLDFYTSLPPFSTPIPRHFVVSRVEAEYFRRMYFRGARISDLTFNGSKTRHAPSPTAKN